MRWLSAAIHVVIALLGLASTAAQAAELSFDLKIEQGRVPSTMRLIRVKQGDTVKLRWVTDRPIILHLHGYDIESKVEPGAVTEMAFLARTAGRFPENACQRAPPSNDR